MSRKVKAKLRVEVEVEIRHALVNRSLDVKKSKGKC